MILLGRAPQDDREDLAKTMLETRAGIDVHTVARKKAEAELAAARVEVTANSARAIGETVAQMQKWRGLADSGLSFLKWASIFSALGVAYVLVFLVHGEKVDAGEGALLIFLLALFAISPAVLLLRERPLKGLDDWSPTGGSAANKGGDGDGGSGAKGKGEAAAKSKAG